MIDSRVRPSGAVAAEAQQRFHAQAFAAALEQGGVAVAQAVELGDEVAAELARGVHALRQVGELGVLVLEQMDEVGERHFVAGSEPRMRSATDSVPDCFWCVAEFLRCSMSPSAAADRLASSCCSCSGSSLMPLGSSVIEIGRPEARPGV